MTALTLLHRWAGGVIGLILMILGLSGAVLVFEDAWIGVPHAGDPLDSDPGRIAHAVEAAAQAGTELTRITFASDDLGVHQAIYADGMGAYLSQSGDVVDRWTSMWQRPELWIFDLHHHLFMGHTGETLTGIAGIIGLFFVISGAILWWRTRRTFRLRLWPARMSRSAIVRHHRDLGIFAAPLLLLIFATGVLMVFDPLSKLLLSPFQSGSAVESRSVAVIPVQTGPADWGAMFRNARARFPEAEFRRLQFPREPRAPFVLRMKQPGEWTPNGRTYLYFDRAGSILAVDNPAKSTLAQAIEEKYYPLHAAKVGGGAWQALVALTGLILAVLGSLTTYTFWFRR